MHVRIMKYLKKRLKLTLAVINFTVWFFIFINGFRLSDNLNHIEPFARNDLITNAMLVFLVILILLNVLVKKHLETILYICSLLGWILFLIFTAESLYPIEFDPFNTTNIQDGIYIIYNYWIFIFLGCSNIGLLSISIKTKLEMVAKTRESIGTDIVIAAAATLLLSLGFHFFRTWNIDIIIAFTSIILYFEYIELRQQNQEKNERENQIEKSIDAVREIPKQESLTVDGSQDDNKFFLLGERNLILGGFSLIIYLIFTYLIFQLGFAPIFFTVPDLGMILISLGILISVIILEISYEKYLKKIPWQYILIFTLILVILFSLATYYSYEYSDSTYITNRPILIGVVIYGMLFGCLLYSINIAFIQYQEYEPGKSNKWIFYDFVRLFHDFGRLLLSYGICFLVLYGMLGGYSLETYNDEFEEWLFYTIHGTPIILALFIGLLFLAVIFSKLNQRINMKTKILETERVVSKIASRTKMKKAIKVAFILLPIIFSIGAFYPKLFPKKPNSAGYPKILGYRDGIIISEISPFSKLGKFQLINGPYDLNDNAPEDTVITRSMAKNEYETIQIALSNWGFKKTQVTNVSVANSTYLGLPSAFSQDPIVKSWKGEEWEWARFTAHYVDDIQPGYPNVLYELNGNQKHAELVYGQNESRPDPIVRSGTSLSLWMTLYAATDLSAGNYTDLITITTNHWVHDVILKTEIWDFEIPVNDTFRTAIGNRRAYKLENRDLFNKNFLKHRMSPYFPFNRSDYYEVDDQIVNFDFTQFEIDLDNSIKHGLDSFRLTFDPSTRVYSQFSEGYNNTAISFYSQLATFLKSRPLSYGGTWLDLALVYAMDEPSEDEYEEFNQWADLVHTADPGLNLLLTEQVETPLIGSVDIWCPFMTKLDPQNIELRQNAGDEFWYYTCCNLMNQPTVLFIDPAVDHRALFWCAYAYNFEGYLFWDAAAYIDQECYDPLKLGYNGMGDAIMLLNDIDENPIDTIVWETMRDGLEDIEYFNILEGLDADSEYVAEVKEEWSDFYHYPRSYTKYLELRQNIGNAINALV
ncbi:MAG: DUF4091 domain-containing protein [Candidatus Lokiarchaeota archaeon]|nr:DUF4091 domain-containing protein [Candidatus Lokiarchaeota archaeon]